MKKEYIIGTFNLKNDLWNKNWEYKKYAKLLSYYIKDNKIDFIATQELTKKYSKELSSNLKKYNIYGSYRFKDISFLSKYDESVGIITKHNPIKTITKYLSLIPGIPRIMTTYEDNNILLINVHLDYKSKLAKKIELKKIYKYIYKNKDKNIILLGDFNMYIDNIYFINFINKLKNININIIDNNNHAFSKKTIDHIFISNSFELIDTWTNKELMSISDHRPVFIKIKLKNQKKLL